MIFKDIASIPFLRLTMKRAERIAKFGESRDFFPREQIL